MARFAQINAPVDSLARRAGPREKKRREKDGATYWRVSGNRLSAARRPEIERSQPSSEIEVQGKNAGPVYFYNRQ